MISFQPIRDSIAGLATHLTDTVYTLPILVLMPHSRCNCRCVMCDIWKANQNKEEISVDELSRHMQDFRALGVRHVTLSGGEALMHSNLWRFCELLRQAGIRISLLSTGLLLERNAVDIVSWVDDVIVSLDGDEITHNQIRQIPDAFEKLHKGIVALRSQRKDFPVTGRSVIQRQNFRSMEATLAAAHRLELNQISFLPVDVSTTAFSRTEGWNDSQVATLALSPDEIDEWEKILKRIFKSHSADFSSNWIAESPAKFKWMIEYFRALNGLAKHHSPSCNAPWVSAVVESNGDIRPCFFQPPYGNLQDGFSKVVNSESAIQFRKNLHIAKDPTCQHCVCSLSRSWLTLK